MSDYPEALIEKVAKAIAEANGDFDDEHLIWMPYIGDAAAALDAMGLLEERVPSFVKVALGWDEIVNRRRYVTKWEDV